jgi:hypothetical protein
MEGFMKKEKTRIGLVQIAIIIGIIIPCGIGAG